MAHQHRKLHYWLDDVERLQLYAQSAFSKQRALKESLNKAKSQLKHWELKAKEGTEKMKGVDEERDRAKEEAQVAQMATVSAGDVKAQVENNLD